ncbi:MAG: hypothetical protein JOS17DRAFT_97833 [Linnemannia elongata]|nr:MAG: hypothetical protein JOS17DRAFT_97833 [Linnemannia elongata]
MTPASLSLLFLSPSLPSHCPFSLYVLFALFFLPWSLGQLSHLSFTFTRDSFSFLILANLFAIQYKVIRSFPGRYPKKFINNNNNISNTRA